MVHHRNWIILAVVVFTLIVFIPSTQAGPPAKPGNPGLPGCLAKVDQLEQIIGALQEEIATLQASLNIKDQTIAAQQATIATLEDEINTLNASLKYVLPKTGQTSTTDIHGVLITSDDGYLQKGIEWPVPRFTDNGDGTVTDHLTQLVWLKNANCFGVQDWYGALFSTEDLATGQCQLTDGSAIGDWRLPNRNELLSMVDIEIEIDAPHIAGIGYFTNMVHDDNYYWTSSTCQYNYPANAFYVKFYDATSGYGGKARDLYRVWPVRDPK